MNDNQKNAEQVADSIELAPDRKSIASECKQAHRAIDVNFREGKKISLERMDAVIDEIVWRKCDIKNLSDCGNHQIHKYYLDAFREVYRAGYAQGCSQMVDAWQEDRNQWRQATEALRDRVKDAVRDRTEIIANQASSESSGS